MTFHRIIPLFLTLAIGGCRDPKVGDLLRGFRGERYLRLEAGDFHSVSVRLVPKAMRLLVAGSADTNSRVSPQLLDSLDAALGGNTGLTFLLRLDPRDTSRATGLDLGKDLLFGNNAGFGSYAETHNEYAFGLREKIWIETDGHKVAMAGYQMENSFGMEPGRAFILLFPELTDASGKRPDNVTLVLDDIVPGLGRRKIQWKLPAGKYEEA